MGKRSEILVFLVATMNQPPAAGDKRQSEQVRNRTLYTETHIDRYTRRCPFCPPNDRVGSEERDGEKIKR